MPKNLFLLSLEVVPNQGWAVSGGKKIIEPNNRAGTAWKLLKSAGLLTKFMLWPKAANPDKP